MNTPIADFLKNYNSLGADRFHMPGHKGIGLIGAEGFDITEISGADVLFEANGIIGESEKNATKLFKCGKTVYSTEGSTLCIKTMLCLAIDRFKENYPNERPHVIAGRNAHKAFIFAAAELDFDIDWIYDTASASICNCLVKADEIKEKLAGEIPPAAVYITTPDYLGNLTDITEISALCKSNSVPLLVDNAHGAYLAFTKNKNHPILLGADMCCDSAHKTLPVLTGGAYLHISASAEDRFAKKVKQAMQIFASTSPSYLILHSLDLANKYISDGYEEKLEDTLSEISKLKKALTEKGFILFGDEPMKMTVFASKCGIDGKKLAEYLMKEKIYPEYYDRDFVCLMPSASTDEKSFERLKKALLSLEIKPTEPVLPPFFVAKSVMSPREAVFSPFEKVKTENALGKIAALPTASCPPAVAVVSSGELVSREAIKVLKYYGIDELYVVKGNHNENI